MASEYLGRSYLVKNDRTVNSLIEILKIEVHSIKKKNYYL